MIRCNLAVLLAERSLKITKVAAETGISRTTLTALSTNRSQGIQFDTLNTLCNYFNVAPNSLVSFIPIDIDVISIDLQEDEFGNEPPDIYFSADICITVMQNGKRTAYQLSGVLSTMDYTTCSFRPDWTPILNLSTQSPLDDNRAAADKNAFMDVLSKVPPPFITDIEASIREDISVILDNKFYLSDLRIIWPNRV